MKHQTQTGKFIALTYLIGGIVGVLQILPQLNRVSLDPVSAFAWLILLAQIAVAVYGGWQLWNFRPIGIQLLYWLSWSCVPVFSMIGIKYWCVIGFGLLPTFSFGFGHTSNNLSFHLGYESTLWFNFDGGNILLGLNIIALWFALALTKMLRENRIKRWPLLWSKDKDQKLH
ncbi:MAG: hypothetical protein FWH15_05650 [Betaproteobacteria bacterium]|nr:hypothetical protein [Betaproteobacteria bacterium]